MNHNDHLTAEKLAVRVGSNVETVWRWVRAGLPHHRHRQPGCKAALCFDMAEVTPWLLLNNLGARCHFMAATESTEGLNATELSGEIDAQLRQLERTENLEGLHRVAVAVRAGDGEIIEKLLAHHRQDLLLLAGLVKQTNTRKGP